MEEKKEQLKKTSVAEKTSKGKYAPKKKVTKTVSKKEYIIVLVNQSSLIVTLDGVSNTKIPRTKKLENLVIGDKVKL